MNSLNNACHARTPATAHTLAIRPGFHRWLTVAVDGALGWIDRARSRRELARLDDRLLKDIGVARTEADREAAKPFWQA